MGRLEPLGLRKPRRFYFNSLAYKPVSAGPNELGSGKEKVRRLGMPFSLRPEVGRPARMDQTTTSGSVYSVPSTASER